MREFSLPEPLKLGQEFQLELRVVGQTLTAKLYGGILGTVTDGTFSRGSFQVNVQEHDAAPTVVKSFEVLNLDAPGTVTPTASGSYPQPSKWLDATAYVRERFLGKELEADGEWLRSSVPSGLFPLMGGQTFHNCVLRVVFADRTELTVRRRTNDGHDRRYVGEININQTAGFIAISSPDFQVITPRVKVPAALGNGAEHEAVFVAQGDELSLWLDGTILTSVHDSSLDSGSLAVGLTKGYRYGDSRIKKIEFGELPDVSPPATSVAASLSPSTEPWQDVLHDPAKLTLIGAVERTPEGLRFTAVGGARRSHNQGSQSDGAVRMLATFSGPGLNLAARSNSAGLYQLRAIDEKTVVLERWENSKGAMLLRKFLLPSPLKVGQDYELELRVVGQTLTAKCNGEVLGSLTDGAFPTGPFYLAFGGLNPAPAVVKALEVLDLDAPGGASAVPVAEPWQDLLADPKKVSLYQVERSAPDAVVLPHSAAIWAKGTHSNAAIRMTATFDPQKLGQALYTKEVKGTGRYNLRVSSASTVLLDRSREDGYQVLRKFALQQPLTAGSEYELELRVTGDLMVAKLNGQVLGEVRDDPHTMGEIGVCNISSSTVEVKALHFLPLDSGP